MQSVGFDCQTVGLTCVKWIWLDLLVHGFGTNIMGGFEEEAPHHILRWSWSRMDWCIKTTTSASSYSLYGEVVQWYHSYLQIGIGAGVNTQFLQNTFEGLPLIRKTLHIDENNFKSCTLLYMKSHPDYEKRAIDSW